MVSKRRLNNPWAQTAGKICRQFWLLLACLWPVMAAGQIISPERFFGHYQQFVWQDLHGLPQNGISEVVQTPDGYLWLATAEGVIRFDGVKFTAFDTGNTPPIKSNNIMSLLVDRSGTLWIGTHGGGVSRYQNGRFAHFSTAEGLTALFAKCLFEDHNGQIWVGTDGGGLNLFRDGRFTAYTVNDGLPNNYISTLGEDKNGVLWVGTRDGLAQFQDGKFKTYKNQDGLASNNISKIFRDAAGDLWIGCVQGLSLWRDGRFTAFGERDGIRKTDFRSIAQDRDGALWLGTIGAGLYRYREGRFEAFSTEQGLINDEIQAVFAEPSGDIWLGTNGGGLAQLKNGRFTTYTAADGLPGNMAGALYEAADGGIWIGTDKGLARFRDGKFTALTLPDGSGLPDVYDISQDQDGNMWLSSGAGDKAVRYQEGSARLEIVHDNVFENRGGVFLPDRAGRIWYGTARDGLHLVERDGREKVFHKQDGLADEYVNALYEARDGSIWVGTRNGLSRVKDNVAYTFTAAEGFTGGHVLSFYEDGAGNLWIGTHGDGLFRLREGRFAVFTSKNGLYDNLAFQIVGDDDGNLWMSGNKGIYRASLTELDDFAAGRRHDVTSFAYGSADGMLSRECNSANPAGVRARDGRLWFPTIKGVVVIDPKKKDTRQPVVSIEKVLVDKQALSGSQAVRMQPEQENLEIQFAALSWSRPSQIRFKYQLVGLDAGWVEAGARRTAYYPHIPPGNYTFRVIADNGDGVWNEAGQSLAVVVLPPFYQTWWFFALCALAAGLVIRWAYSYRLTRLQIANEAKTAFTQQLIESQEQERRRIAVELHDSIGQSLIVIRNRALIGLNAPQQTERLIAQLEEISGSAADSIAEVRRISHNLHPYQLEHLGLTTALETMIEAAGNASPIEFITDIEDIDQMLTKEAEINLYRIVQESLNNILKHSEATQVRVSIRTNNNLLTVAIKDNGKGFNTEHSIRPKGGLGLTGISERAKMLGARHEIFSLPNQGATISLQIALPLSR